MRAEPQHGNKAVVSKRLPKTKIKSGMRDAASNVRPLVRGKKGSSFPENRREKSDDASQASQEESRSDQELELELQKMTEKMGELESSYSEVQQLAQERLEGLEQKENALQRMKAHARFGWVLGLSTIAMIIVLLIFSPTGSKEASGSDKLDELQKRNQELELELQKMTEKIGDLESSYSELQQLAQDRLDTAQFLNRELEQRENALRRMRAETGSSINSYEGRVRTLATEKTELSLSNEKLKSQNTGLTSRIRELETNLKVKEAELREIARKEAPLAVDNAKVPRTGIVHWRCQDRKGEVLVEIWENKANVGMVTDGVLPQVPVKFTDVNRVGRVEILSMKPPTHSNSSAQFILRVKDEDPFGLVIFWERLGQ
ncbi:hypothetical protein MYX78_00240 [Acidobacteria bacterium AH-259-G07]|nr:hypothetical protein [Acidobacteria bacterium AH-259-G07]